METLVEVMEFDTWRYIALVAFFVLTNFVAYNYGFVRGGTYMYWYCKDVWNIKDDEDEEEENQEDG